MKNPKGSPSKRLARVLGLVLVLGLPLATVSPLDSGLDRPGTASNLTASGDVRLDDPAEQILDGHEAAHQSAPLPDFDSIEIRQSDPSNGAPPVTSIVNDPRCGPGFTSAGVTGQDAFTCFHTAPDLLPEVSGPVAQAAVAAPVCMGNGVNGPRVQLIYMYVEGQPDRTNVMVPRIINEFVPRMEGVFRETSRLQGREIGMRLHMPGCRIEVDTLMIDPDRGAPRDVAPQYFAIVDALKEAGYDSSDRKYLLWFDGGNASGACGVAPAGYPPLLGGYVDLVPALSDNPTPVNRSNVGWQAFGGYETAIAFRYGFPVLGEARDKQGRPMPECWGRGGTGARTELHELLHLLGAVNLSAPNSNGQGHCLDGLDIMCDPGQGAVKPRCVVRVELLDCGGDDYFNARPAAGSYLSTHWNTANSRFLGNAVIHDAVPVVIPRP